MIQKGDINLLFFECATYGQLLIDENYNIFRITDKGDLAFIQDTNILDYFDDDSCRSLIEAMDKLDEEYISFKNIYLTGKNGIPFEGVILKHNNIFRLFIKDLSKNVEAWQKLMFFYRNFINNPNPMFITDMHGIILDANKALYDLYGYTVEEVIGSKPSIFKSFRQAPSEYKRMWDSLLNKDIGQYRGNIFNRKKDGTEVFVNVFVNTVFDYRKNIIGFIATHFESTHQKNIEQKAIIRDQEANILHRELLNIISIVSHDIKGQINGIINYLEIMGFKEPEKQKEYLEKAKNIALSLNRFVSDTLSISRIERGINKPNFSRCHILGLLKECISNLSINAVRKNIKIILNENGTNYPVICDIIKTEEIFNNLIENAIKYTEEGKEIIINFTETDELIEIDFIDSGKGIDEKIRGKIFDLFFVADSRKEGYGLGLYIVKSYADLQNWEIEVSNRADATGAVFKLKIKKDSNKSFDSSIAVIYDPSMEYISRLDNLFREKNVITYKVKNIYELERVFNLENPEIIMINYELFDDKLRSFVNHVNGKKKKENYLIGFSENKFADSAFDFCLSADELDKFDFNRVFKG